MSGLYVPESACDHPRDKLRCDLRSPAGDTNPDHVRAVVQCLQCMALWTHVNLPGDIIDKLLECLSMGYLKQWPAQ